jgi:hypothetical protein
MKSLAPLPPLAPCPNKVNEQGNLPTNVVQRVYTRNIIKMKDQFVFATGK